MNNNVKNLYESIDPETYDKKYHNLPREIYLNNHWKPIIYNLINKYCLNKDVIDLGCGYGKYFDIIAKKSRSAVGVDNSKRWLEYAQKKFPNQKFILADADNTGLNGKFDVVVSIGMFEYVDRASVMEEIGRLVDSGHLIISVPNKYSLIRMLRNIYAKVLGREREAKEPSEIEMLRLFSTNGFVIVEEIMDDGLIYLPNCLDKFIGIKTYKTIERIFNIFGKNPFSSNMVFVAKR